jgi:hypothetical protein
MLFAVRWQLWNIFCCVLASSSQRETRSLSSHEKLTEQLQFSHPRPSLPLGQGIAEVVRTNGRVPQQFSIQHPNPTFPETKFATPSGLQMFFRSNTYWFDRVGFAADQYWAFIAPVDNAAVVVMLSKTGLGPGQKCFHADWAAHDFGQWFNTLPNLPPLAPNRVSINFDYFLVEPKDRF